MGESPKARGAMRQSDIRCPPGQPSLGITSEFNAYRSALFCCSYCTTSLPQDLLRRRVRRLPSLSQLCHNDLPHNSYELEDASMVSALMSKHIAL